MREEKETGILRRILFLILGIFVAFSYQIIVYIYTAITQVSSISLDNATLKLLLSGIWVVVAFAVTLITRQKPLESFRFFMKNGKDWALVPPIAIFAFIFGICLNRLITVLLSVLPISTKIMTEYENATATTISGENPIIIVISLYLIAPIVEEMIFRGKSFFYISNAFDEPFGVIIASILTSVIFGLNHGSLVQVVYAIFCGLVFSVLSVKTESIITTIFAHMGFNLGNVILNSFTSGRDDKTLLVVNIICFVLIPVTFAVIWMLSDINKESVEEKQEESIYLR